jgi:predicted O-methyltransferase YrrM
MRVYDCFPFLNELELLEIRLHELSEVVDRWVIVEATETYSGAPRTPALDLRDERWMSFRERIIHIVVDDLPGGGGEWGREEFQRNCILRGLKECDPLDLIILSDADEIPRATAVHRVRETLVSGVAALKMDLCYYHLNQRGFVPEIGRGSDGTVAWYRSYQGRAIRRHELMMPNDLRRYPAESAAICIDDAGWHFSYCGGVDRIRQKIASFSHQELNTSRYTTSNHIERAVHLGEDLFDRNQIHQFHAVPIDDWFPAYLVANQERFRDLIAEVSGAQVPAGWASLLSVSIDAYYDGNLAAGREACDRLLCLPHVPGSVIDETRRNLLFYARPLAEQAEGVEERCLDLGSPEGGVTDGPSMIADGDGFTILARTETDGQAVWRRARFGPDWEPCASPIAVPDAWMGGGDAVRWPRIVELAGQLTGLVAAEDQAGEKRLALIAPALDPERLQFGAHRDLEWGSPRAALPAATSDGLVILDGLSPVVVRRCDAGSSVFDEPAVRPGSRLLAWVRCGAPLVRFGTGWLAVTREDAEFEAGPRALHRFVEFDASFQVRRISFPFIFRDPGEEQCGSIALDGDGLILVYASGAGIWTARVPLLSLDSLLQPAEAVGGEPAQAARPAHARDRFPEQWSDLLRTLTVGGAELITDTSGLVSDVAFFQSGAESKPRPLDFLQGLSIERNDSPKCDALRGQLYNGMDLTQGFDPSGHPSDLQTWEGSHPIFDRLVAEARPSRIVEVGTWKGMSAISMARAMKSAGIVDGEVVCVDTWLGGPENLVEPLEGGGWQVSRWASSLRRLHGYPQLYYTFLSNVVDAGLTDVITPLPLSSDAGATVLSTVGYRADLIYIDGGHTYDSVTADLQGYWPIVRPGGLLFGHDFSWIPDVERAVRDFTSSLNISFEVDAPFFVIRKR